MTSTHDRADGGIEIRNSARSSVLHLTPEEARLLREHFREDRPGLLPGERALAPILHPDGSGCIDFDGGLDGQTVVTLRVIEKDGERIILEVQDWAETEIRVIP